MRVLPFKVRSLPTSRGIYQRCCGVVSLYLARRCVLREGFHGVMARSSFGVDLGVREMATRATRRLLQTDDPAEEDDDAGLVVTIIVVIVLTYVLWRILRASVKIVRHSEGAMLWPRGDDAHRSSSHPRTRVLTAASPSAAVSHGYRADGAVQDDAQARTALYRASA